MDEEEKEKRQKFYAELDVFHRRRNSSFKIPRLSGKPIDLYSLYNQVVNLGGFKKVTNYDLWREVASHLNFPFECAGADHVVKLMFTRYLAKYHQVKVFGDDHDDVNETIRSVRKSVGAVPSSTPMQRRSIIDMNKSVDMVASSSNGSSDPTDHTPYVRLVRSLQSGLPNEVSAAINVCLVMSSTQQGKNCVPEPGLIPEIESIVQLLLAHVGFFDESGAGKSLKRLYLDEWRLKQPASSRLTEFWQENVIDIDEKKHEFAIENIFLSENLPETKFRSITTPFERNLFNLTSHQNSDRNLVRHKIIQIGNVLRNLSFETGMKPLLAKDQVLLRFLLTCINIKYASIYSLGWDTLSNLAPEISIPQGDSTISRILFESLNRALHSDDKFRIMRALETIGGLCANSDNESELLSYFDGEVLHRINQLLALKDVMLCVYLLECLYTLSDIGEMACQRLVEQHKLLDTLVHLATIEAVSYGPNGLAGMKVVEYGVPRINQQQQHSNSMLLMQPPQQMMTSHWAAAAVTPINQQLRPGALTSPQLRPPGQQGVAAPDVQVAPPRSMQPVAVNADLMNPVAVPNVAPTSNRLLAQLIERGVTSPNHLSPPIVVTNINASDAQLYNKTISTTTTNHDQVTSSHQQQNHTVMTSTVAGQRFHSPGVLKLAPPTVVDSPPTLRPVCTATPKKRRHDDAGKSPLQAGSFRGPALIMEQNEEAEKLVTSWLKLNCQADPKALVSRAELYSAYVQFVGRTAGYHDRIAPLSAMAVSVATFSNLIRQAFPSCEIQLTTTTTGDVNCKSQVTQISGIKFSSQTCSVEFPSQNGGLPSMPNNIVKNCPKINPGKNDPSPELPPAPVNTTTLVASQHPLTRQILLRRVDVNNKQIGSNDSPNFSNDNSAQPPLVNGVSPPIDNDAKVLIDLPPKIDKLGETTTPQNGMILVKKLTNGDATKLTNQVGCDDVTPAMMSPPPRPADKMPLLSSQDDADSLMSNTSCSPITEANSMGPPTLGSPFNAAATVSNDAKVNGDCAASLVVQSAGLAMPLTACYSPGPSAERIQRNVEQSRENIQELLTTGSPLASATAIEVPVAPAVASESSDNTPPRRSQRRNMNQAVMDDISATIDFVTSHSERWQPPPKRQRGHVAAPLNQKINATPSSSLSCQNSNDDSQFTCGNSNSSRTSPISTGSSSLEAQYNFSTPTALSPGGGSANSTPKFGSSKRNRKIGTSNRKTIVTLMAGQSASPIAANIKGRLKSSVDDIIDSVASSIKEETMVKLSAEMANQDEAMKLFRLPMPVSDNHVPSQPTHAVSGNINVTNNNNNGATCLYVPQAVTLVPDGLQRSAGNAGHQIHVVQQQQPGLQQPQPCTSSVNFTTTASGQSQQQQTYVILRFACEWDQCGRFFDSANQLSYHVCHEHLPSDEKARLLCSWANCDKFPRRKWALMAHVQELHCNERYLRTAAIRRHELSANGYSKIPESRFASPHPGYPDDAAVAAIRRHAFVNLNKDVTEDYEGPVTKNLRLTSCLILRNLARYSSDARRRLRRYESLISWLAFSQMESSAALAQCLSELYTTVVAQQQKPKAEKV